MDGHDYLLKCISKPKTLEDLPVGAHFIYFPRDGDDNGHGGFKNGANLKTKIEAYHPGVNYHESFLYTCVPFGKDIHEPRNHESLPLRALIIQVRLC